jgi:hypothetical protein
MWQGRGRGENEDTVDTEVVVLAPTHLQLLDAASSTRRLAPCLLGQPVCATRLTAVKVALDNYW